MLYNKHFHLSGIIWKLIFTSSVFVFGYNIETKKVGIMTGHPKSQFGYSVALLMSQDGLKNSKEKKQSIKCKLLYSHIFLSFEMIII